MTRKIRPRLCSTPGAKAITFGPTWGASWSGWITRRLKNIFCKVPKPVTGGGLRPNYRIDRITRSCQKAADFGCFLFRFLCEGCGCVCCPAELAVMIPGEFCTDYPWNRKETLMITLLRVAIAALVLISAGCSSMDGNTSSSGDPSSKAQSSLYLRH